VHVEVAVASVGGLQPGPAGHRALWAAPGRHPSWRRAEGRDGFLRGSNMSSMCCFPEMQGGGLGVRMGASGCTVRSKHIHVQWESLEGLLKYTLFLMFSD